MADLERISREDQARKSSLPADFDSYRDPGGVARLLRGMLIVKAFASATVIGFSLAYLSALGNEQTGAPLLSSTIGTATDRLNLSGRVSGVFFYACAIVFVIWTYRVYQNLKFLGAADLRYGEGWAIGGWLVPLLNFVRPKQIVNDAWRASNPDNPATALRSEWLDRAPPLLLAWWWGLYLLATVANPIRRQIDDATVSGAQTRTWVSIGGFSAEIAAAFLAVLVVQRLTERQQRRAHRLSQLVPTPLEVAGVSSGALVKHGTC